MQIPVPFLKEEVGSGDLVKAALSSIGIKQKRGCKCPERQAGMNRDLSFVPMTPAKPTEQGTVGAPLSLDLGERAAIVSGAIPPGLTFDGKVLSGTPVQAGVFRMAVRCGGQQRQVFIRIAEAA